jgi:hypothetical protein
MKGPARKIRPFLRQIPQSDYLAHPLQSKNCDLLFPEHAITGIARRYPGDKYTTPANWQPRTHLLLVSQVTTAQVNVAMATLPSKSTTAMVAGHCAKTRAFRGDARAVCQSVEFGTRCKDRDLKAHLKISILRQYKLERC